MTHVLQVLNAISWPIAILVLAFVFYGPIRGVINRLRQVKAPLLELYLDELVQKKQLSVGARAELSGLSGHDIWALHDFAISRITVLVDKMNAPQKVEARTLIDLKLLTLDGEGPNRKVVITPLGSQILEAAKLLI